MLTGAWLGVFIGLVLGLLTGNPGQALVTGVIAGVGFGLITSSIPYAMSKGTDPALVKRFQSALEAIEPETRRIMKTYQDIGLE